ncbi:MAG: PfkB family carbohydrate kinase [Chitinophagaceae bacterium]|jgi:2-dehydro-3-deoxygluconokinase
MAKKIVTLGEIMLRLSPPGYNRVVLTNQFDATYGGSEANVAISLSRFGKSIAHVTKVPEHAVGQAVVDHLRRHGVDSSFVLRGGERLGVYYLENGVSMRSPQVIYDRKGAAFAEASVSEYDIDSILSDADWFHVSGITPALSDSCAELTTRFMTAARKKGITTSIDLNYRKKLWSREKAVQTLMPLCRLSDVCIGADASLLSSSMDVQHDDVAAVQPLLAAMQKEFGFRYIVTTVRVSHSASDNDWSAVCYDGSSFHASRQYAIRIVDRVGGGDGFAAGLIYGLHSGWSLSESTDFATAAGALKHTIPGDINLVTVDEVNELMRGDGSGKVQR